MSSKISRIVDRFFIKQPRLRRFLTRILTGQRIASIDLLGAELIVDSIQEHGYYRASRFARHSSFFFAEAPVVVTLASFIRCNTTFVDIGANVGVYSSVMSRFSRLIPGFNVVAFEVNPRTFVRLQMNAMAHGFDAYNFGIGDANAHVEFVEGAVSHVTTRKELANSYNILAETFLGKIRKLADFNITGNLILKIDVEGQERDVLEGSRRYFESNQVRCVYLDGYSDKSCLDFLQGFGFSLMDGRTLRPIEASTFSLLATKGFSGAKP